MTIAAGGPFAILAPLGAGGVGDVYRRFDCSGVRAIGSRLLSDLSVVQGLK